MLGLKNLRALAMSALLVFNAGCAKTNLGMSRSLPQVKLSVWSDERNDELINKIIEEFKAEYSSEANIEVTLSDESEVTCKETVLEDPENAGDIFVFADDQLDELWRAGALLEITDDTNAVIEENGGADSSACRSAMRDNKLYAYPETAGNGYFLYYNSNYFTAEDVTSFDRILEVAKKNGKKVSMDFSEGWYIYSFFKGAGLELGRNEDGVTNYCNWNATDTDITGAEVAQAMLNIAQHPNFYSYAEEQFTSAVEDGSIIAGVSGAWNATIVEKAFGDGYSATKLPTYTVDGRQVQMCSFTGYKLVGVNAHTQNAEWAMRLARKMTDEESQLRRFEFTGECPSNINASASDEVQSSPAVSALAKQSEYGYIQSVAEPFWNPSAVFGITIAGGNADNRDLQSLLDTMVDGITAKE